MDLEESFLAMLRCPRTGGELRLAGAEELAALNQSLLEGKLKNAAGRKMERSMEGAMVSACGRWLYPVHDGIPVLLVEEALQLGQP